MSAPHDIRQESDHLPGRPLTFVGVVTVLIGVASVAVQGVMLSFQEQGLSARSRSPHEMPSVAPRRIGRVEQTLIEKVEHEPAHMASDRRVLAGYGWVDRSAGVARIPIERAIEIVERQAADAASSASATPGSPR